METGGPGIQGSPHLHREFEVTSDYIKHSQEEEIGRRGGRDEEKRKKGEEKERALSFCCCYCFCFETGSSCISFHVCVHIYGYTCGEE